MGKKTKVSVTLSISGDGADGGIKPFKELAISDSFMFAKIFGRRENCERLLRVAVGADSGGIDMAGAEVEIRPSPAAKYSRLDIRAEGGDAMFDVEMQRRLAGDLPRRARYYQSLMDTESLQSGALYSDLKASYVIFFCLGDLFKKGLPLYTFRCACAQYPSLDLNDGTVKMFYNCGAYSKAADADVSALLEYFSRGSARTAFTRSLDEEVRAARSRATWEKAYMDFEMERRMLLAEGDRKGYERGMERGKAESAKALSQRDAEIERLMAENAALKKAARL